MAVTYEWQVSNMERNLADGGVTIVHWNCVGTENEISARSYGTTSHTPDASASDFVAFDDLTEDVVLGWVHASLDRDEIEASIASKIDALANPTTASGVSW